MTNNESSIIQLVSPKTIIQIPTEVAKCPYCDTQIHASFHGWQVGDDRQWFATEATLECETEPDWESDEWDDWWQSHYIMPYVYLLPVELKVLEWVNSRYRFELETSKE